MLSAFVLIGNPLIVLVIMGAMGYRARTSFLAGLTVAQISEFSLILAALGPVSVPDSAEQELGFRSATPAYGMNPLPTTLARTFAVIAMVLLWRGGLWLFVGLGVAMAFVLERRRSRTAMSALAAVRGRLRGPSTHQASRDKRCSGDHPAVR